MMKKITWWAAMLSFGWLLLLLLGIVGCAAEWWEERKWR